tara:strand:+ start:118 stop:663 length:546 start_codon:yes stop_codon:yes gene_type:complete
MRHELYLIKNSSHKVIKMKSNIFVMSAVVVLLTGCSSAQRSSEVNAVYVPADQYKSMSCTELSASAEELRKRTPALAKAVDDARKTDKLVEAGGWLLFAPALLFMDGNAEESAALASAKGQLDAIRTASITADCSAASTKVTVTKDTSQMSVASGQCADLGYVKGTEKFADCVMTLINGSK